MSAILYALVTAVVLQAGGTLDRASVIEGLSLAECEAQMRARVEAGRVAGTGLRVYAMCVPMPGRSS